MPDQGEEGQPTTQTRFDVSTAGDAPSDVWPGSGVATVLSRIAMWQTDNLEKYCHQIEPQADRAAAAMAIPCLMTTAERYRDASEDRFRRVLIEHLSFLSTRFR
jgi:hypothetical protein